MEILCKHSVHGTENYGIYEWPICYWDYYKDHKLLVRIDFILHKKLEDNRDIVFEYNMCTVPACDSKSKFIPINIDTIRKIVSAMYFRIGTMENVYDDIANDVSTYYGRERIGPFYLRKQNDKQILFVNLLNL